jgi:hypothetical protein
MAEHIPATFRLPATDPCFAIQPDPTDDAIGMALADGARLALDFQHPGCAPDRVELWLREPDYTWAYRFASQGRDAGGLWWPSVRAQLGALADFAGWAVVPTGVTK